MNKDQRVAMMRHAATKANPYLAGVLRQLAADVEARGAAPIASAEPRQPDGETPRTLQDYMRPVDREPGEEG